MDSKSGKPIANVVVYEYEDGPERYRVSYRRSETIVDEKLITRVSGFKHLLAKLTGFDGAYLRFTGNVQLERFVNGELVEDVSDPGIWEMMYLGHVYGNHHRKRFFPLPPWKMIVSWLYLPSQVAKAFQGRVFHSLRIYSLALPIQSLAPSAARKPMRTKPRGRI